MKPYYFADLFAGCGGLSLGLVQAGLKGRFAIERDPMAFQTFAGNFLNSGLPDVRFEWPTWLKRQAWDIERLLSQHANDLLGMREMVPGEDSNAASI